MNKTSIEWCDYSANLLKWREKATGKTVWHCAVVSPGCTHCYAQALAKRYGKGGPFTERDDHLYEPFVCEKEIKALLKLNEKEPGAKVFLNDMTDTFHKSVSDEMLDRMFAVMALCPNLIFQALTKRAERMRDYLTSPLWCERIAARVVDAPAIVTNRGPLANVWLGVSCEDQQRADERILLLLQTPAAVRFVSYEPAISEIDFRNLRGGTYNALDGIDAEPEMGFNARLGDGQPERGIDWIIVGGESGPGARPFDLAWARYAIAQCRDAEVPVFVKQIGAEPYQEGELWIAKDRKGGSMDEWPADLRVRQYPGERQTLVLEGLDG